MCPALIGRQWWVIKSPIAQIIVCGVCVPFSYWSVNSNLHPMTLCLIVSKLRSYSSTCINRDITKTSLSLGRDEFIAANVYGTLIKSYTRISTCVTTKFQNFAGDEINRQDSCRQHNIRVLPGGTEVKVINCVRYFQGQRESSHTRVRM